MFKLKAAVKLDRTYEAPEHSHYSDITGVVVGYGFIQDVPTVMVELDYPFYDPSNRMFVRVLSCHPDSLLPI